LRRLGNGGLIKKTAAIGDGDGITRFLAQHAYAMPGFVDIEEQFAFGDVGLVEEVHRSVAGCRVIGWSRVPGVVSYQLPVTRLPGYQVTRLPGGWLVALVCARVGRLPGC
jgi:hypothetical protein